MFKFLKKKVVAYRFHQTENTAYFICDHIFNNQKPIHFVSHDLDEGFWQILCGQNDHKDSSLRIISLKQATA
jgi:hypothetical protein